MTLRGHMKPALVMVGVLGCGGNPTEPTPDRDPVAADVVGVYDLSTDQVFRYVIPGCFFGGIEGDDSVAVGFGVLDLRLDSSFSVAWERSRHCYTSEGDSPGWMDTLRLAGNFTTRGFLLDSIDFIHPVTVDLLGVALRDDETMPPTDRIEFKVDEHHFDPYALEFTRR